MKNRVLSPVIQALVFAALLLGLSPTARPVVALADDGEAQGNKAIGVSFSRSFSYK